MNMVFGLLLVAAMLVIGAIYLIRDIHRKLNQGMDSGKSAQERHEEAVIGNVVAFVNSVLVALSVQRSSLLMELLNKRCAGPIKLTSAAEAVLRESPNLLDGIIHARHPYKVALVTMIDLGDIRKIDLQFIPMALLKLADRYEVKT